MYNRTFSIEFIILIAPMIPLNLSNSFQYIPTNLQSNIFAASCTFFFMPKKYPLGSIFEAWEDLDVKILQINTEKIAENLYRNSKSCSKTG